MAKATRNKILIGDTQEELDEQLAALNDPTRPQPLDPEEPIPGQGEDDQPGMVYDKTEVDPEISDVHGDRHLTDQDLDPDADDPIQAHNDLRRSLYTNQRKQVIHGEVIDRPSLRYEGRITIVDAWQYPGGLQQAPQWIDRNWVGFGDYDEMRDIPPGPCLRVPNAAGDVVLCRIGDYVAQQEVKIDDSLSDLRIEVWAKEQFERLFIPLALKQKVFG
jgi:hypothetical protein